MLRRGLLGCFAALALAVWANAQNLDQVLQSESQRVAVVQKVKPTVVSGAGSGGIVNGTLLSMVPLI